MMPSENHDVSPCPTLHISDMLSEGRRLMWPICVRSRVRITTTEPALVWWKHIILLCAVFVFLYLCDNARTHTIRVFALVWCEHFIRCFCFWHIWHLTLSAVVFRSLELTCEYWELINLCRPETLLKSATKNGWPSFACPSVDIFLRRPLCLGPKTQGQASEWKWDQTASNSLALVFKKEKGMVQGQGYSHHRMWLRTGIQVTKNFQSWCSKKNLCQPM